MRSCPRNAIRVGVTCRASCELREVLFPVHHLPLAFVFPQKEGEAERRQTLIRTRLRMGSESRRLGFAFVLRCNAPPPIDRPAHLNMGSYPLSCPP